MFEKNNLRGIIWLLISVVGAAAMTIAVRQVSLTIDSRMIVLLRSAISAIAMLTALVMFSGLRRHLKFSRPWMHLLRGSLIASATHFGFYTIANIPLATATVLFFMAPVFATVLATIMHGERVGPRRWAAVGAGFIGAVIVLRPGFSEFHPAMITALASSFCFAMALTLSRGLATADGAFSTYFSSVIITVIMSIPLAVPVFSLPSTSLIWVMTMVVAITSALRGYADIEAYRWGESSVLAPIAYLRLVLIAGAGYLLFGEVPDGATILGASVIIAATLYIAYRERKIIKAMR